MTIFRVDHRPGYFGKRKPAKIAELNQRFGEGNWELRWILPNLTPNPNGPPGQQIPELVQIHETWDFRAACVAFYEESYVQWFIRNPQELEFVCQFTECYDNALSNVHSGFEYTRQETTATHIQDIAVRCALARLGRRFLGTNNRMLQIRSADSEGFRFGPGNIPFFNPGAIVQPELTPWWAKAGSVESFWQSNKYVLVRI